MRSKNGIIPAIRLDELIDDVVARFRVRPRVMIERELGFFVDQIKYHLADGRKVKLRGLMTLELRQTSVRPFNFKENRSEDKKTPYYEIKATLHPQFLELIKRNALRGRLK